MKNSLRCIAVFTAVFLAAGAALSSAQIPLSSGWKFSKGDNPKWASPKFSDKRWADIAVKKGWEEAGYPGYDGYGWYRIRVNIPSKFKNDPYVLDKKYLVLFLGAIDDADETFFNGELIGSMGKMPPANATAWAEERAYRIPVEKILWDKDNLVAVRVYDSGGGGGLYKGKPEIRVPGWKDFVPMRPGLAGGDGVFPFGVPMSLSCFLSNGSLEDLKGSLVCVINDEADNFLKAMTNAVDLARGKSVDGVFKYQATQPGLYHVTFTLKAGDKQRFLMMYFGYGLDHVNPPLTRKKDFQAFWDRARADLAKVPPEFNVIEKPELSANGVKVYLVEMRSLGGALVRGWYTVPQGPGPFPAVLQVPGHSSSMGPATWINDFAVLALNIRGHGNSKDSVNPGFPGYLVSGLESEETYIYRGAYMDCLRAVDFLASRPEVDKKRIAVEGGSQGGALSFATAALDPRVSLCAPDVPFLSDFRTYFRVTGWPGFEFKNYCASHPGFTEDAMYGVLSYFDIMNLAPWIKCPVFMGSGLQDRTCPPTINFAAFNKVPGEKEARVYPFGQHEGGGGVHWSAKYEWIRRHFGMIK
jgi:cephalosporin-C deacetylase-like acetyl esterase